MLNIKIEINDMIILGKVTVRGRHFRDRHIIMNNYDV